MRVENYPREDGMHYVRFKLTTETFSRTAYVVGNFTGWVKGAVPFTWCGKDYCANLVLPPGTYQYSLELDNEELPQGKDGEKFAPLVLPPIPSPAKSDPGPIYEIFPDRFLCRGGGTEDLKGIMGEDLDKIRQKLGYVRSLGFKWVYMTPIFQSESYHRYDVTDYLSVDDRLGGNDAFRRFLETAHSLGLSVLLDLPFHHTSWRHPAFLSAKTDGRYRSWYYVDEAGYDTFAKVKSMPKLNGETAVNMLKDVIRFWSTFGVDGFRLDVAEGMPPRILWDLSDYAGKPMIAEVYDEPYIYRNAVTGVMNYQIWMHLMAFLEKRETGIELSEIMSRQKLLLPSSFLESSWLFLGTHDTKRALSALGDAEKVKAGLAFVYTWVGTPMVYYGDEVGMTGGDDPDNRRCMDWGAALQGGQVAELIKSLNSAWRPNRSVLLNGADENSIWYVSGNSKVTISNDPDPQGRYFKIETMT